MTAPITLIGDGIENPWNARTLIAAAGMFGGRCRFRDRAGLAGAWRETVPDGGPLDLLTAGDLARDHAPIVACDTLPGAAEVYGARLGAGDRPALVVGNERRGLARDMQTLATQAVRIPLTSPTLSSLNVAAAGAVALYYLSRGGGARLQAHAQPRKRRPELLLIGGADHIELGSAIRSAGAFGWARLLVEDRAGVWFGADRGTRSEGRAAARRARNPIRLIPAAADARYAFDEVCVVTTGRRGLPLHRANLARGARQLVVIPDEGGRGDVGEDWQRLGRVVRSVHLDLPRQDFAYHYRLIATIALAEVARQVEGPARAAGRTPPRGTEPLYDRALAVLDAARGETVYLDDLGEY